MAGYLYRDRVYNEETGKYVNRVGCYSFNELQRWIRDGRLYDRRQAPVYSNDTQILLKYQHQTRKPQAHVMWKGQSIICVHGDNRYRLHTRGLPIDYKLLRRFKAFTPVELVQGSSGKLWAKTPNGKIAFQDGMIFTEDGMVSYGLAHIRIKIA